METSWSLVWTLAKLQLIWEVMKFAWESMSYFVQGSFNSSHRPKKGSRRRMRIQSNWKRRRWMQGKLSMDLNESWRPCHLGLESEILFRSDFKYEFHDSKFYDKLNVRRPKTKLRNWIYPPENMTGYIMEIPCHFCRHKSTAVCHRNWHQIPLLFHVIYPGLICCYPGPC